MLKMEVMFRVRAPTGYGDKVCVVGDCPELGNWHYDKAKILSLEAQTSKGMSVWSRSLRLPPRQEVRFRYLICHFRETEHEDDKHDIIVREWETNIRPRTISLLDVQENETEPKEDCHVFGQYDGQTSIDQGWLTGQSEIRFRLHSNPIHMWKPRWREQQYRIKCSPLDLRHKDLSIEDEDSQEELTLGTSTNRVLVSNLNGDEDEPSEQSQFGTLCKQDGYLVFRSQFYELETMGYQFDFYLHDPNAGPNDLCRYIGNCFLLPLNVKEPIGIKQLAIIGLRHRPIGQLKVDYIIVHPLRGLKCDCSVSYARHWKRQRGPLDVGHRGLGTSYTQLCPCVPCNTSAGSVETVIQEEDGEYVVPETDSQFKQRMRKCEAVRENTIASLSEAGGHGADFVEFDVQLSKDNVPVVYHDLIVCLSLKKKNCQELEWFDLPVHDLNLDQLQKLQVDHVSTKTKGTPQPNDGEPEGAHPFPTLQEVFSQLDDEIGFNIEIKYCMQLKTGGLEDNLKHYKERNEYVDTILNEILTYARNRRVILSSFDPDICTMVRLKQNRYPVLFLSQGNTPRYPSFHDTRADVMTLSCHFSHSEALLGVNLHTEDLMRAGPVLIELCHRFNLVVFCWGEDNNSVETIHAMRALGVDGIIYDRINELNPGEKKNKFKMEKEAKLSLLKDVGCLVHGGSRSNSPTNGQASNNTAEVASTSKLCNCEASMTRLSKTYSIDCATQMSQTNLNLNNPGAAANASNGAANGNAGAANASYGASTASNGVIVDTNGVVHASSCTSVASSTCSSSAASDVTTASMSSSVVGVVSAQDTKSMCTIVDSMAATAMGQ